MIKDLLSIFKKQKESQIDILREYPFPTYMQGNNDDERIRLNKEFEKILKKDDIWGDCPPSKKYRLKKAYESNSIASLYYWLENSPVDFNTGSDIAVTLLHYKYEKIRGHYYSWLTGDLQNFIYKELPDLSENELKDLGFSDKKDLVEAILASYTQLQQNEKAIIKKYRSELRVVSPFLTYEYWLAFYRHKNSELTFNEEKENDELKKLYAEWFNQIVLRIIKHNAYPWLELSSVYDAYYSSDGLLGKYKKGDLNTNQNIIEIYSGDRESGYKIAYRLIDSKILYSGNKGKKIAYRIDGDKIYAGETDSKIVYRIGDNIIYLGETGTQIAFRISTQIAFCIKGKEIYSGESGNKVAYRIEH